mgnify:CR=1 FL=1
MSLHVAVMGVSIFSLHFGMQSVMRQDVCKIHFWLIFQSCWRKKSETYWMLISSIWIINSTSTCTKWKNMSQLREHFSWHRNNSVFNVSMKKIINIASMKQNILLLSSTSTFVSFMQASMKEKEINNITNSQLPFHENYVGDERQNKWHSRDWVRVSATR